MLYYNSLLLSLILLGLIILLLWLCNRSRSMRYQQLWSPVTASLLSVIALYCSIKGIGVEFINNLTDYILSAPQSLLATPINPYPENLKERLESIEYFPLFYNYALLIFFLLIKLLVHTPPAVYNTIKRINKRRDTDENENEKNINIILKKLSFAYIYDSEREKGGVYLKDDFVYPGKFMRIISVGAFLLLVVSIFIAYWNNGTKEPDSSLFYLFRFPAISLLIICEIGWYLGGLRPPLKIKEETNRNKEPQLGRCKDLWEEYKRIWNDYILAEEEGKPRIGTKQTCFNLNSNIEEELRIELEYVVKKLSGLGMEIDNDQRVILQSLWSNKDVLISENIYLKASPVIFASLQRDLHHGYNVLFLIGSTEDEAIIKELKAWIYYWLEKRIFSKIDFKVESIVSFYGQESVLIASVNDLMKYKINNWSDWFKNLKTVVTVNIPETIFSNIPPAAAIFNLLNGHSNHSIQKIMLTTEKRKNMESSIRQYLTSKPEEFYLPLNEPEDLCYIVWKTEGKEPLQKKALAHCPRYIGAGAALSIPALRNGNIDTINFTGVYLKPWHEYIEEMDIALENSCKEAIDIIVNKKLPYICSKEDTSFIISYDKDFNIPTTLIKAVAFGSQSITVHIVSPPYLLRDYFAENIEFFLKRHMESTGTLAPVMMREPWSVAYYLKERLMTEYVSEEEVIRHINRVEYKQQKKATAVEDRLDQLFRESFGLDLRERLNIKTNDKFDAYKHCFEKKTRVELEKSISVVIPDIWKTVYRIIDPDGNLFKIIPKDHIYQNYLPEQIHSFYGKPFKIKAIDHDALCIETENVTPESTSCYRPVNFIKVNNKPILYKESISNTVVLNTGKEIRKNLYEADFEISTLGYFSFMCGIDFSTGAHYIPLDKKIKDSRAYKSGRMLCIEIANKKVDSSINDAEYISFTIALLLNEMFCTIFPETCQYVIAASPYDLLNKNENIVTEDLPAQLLPIFQHKDKTDSVCIYVFEDSTADMGLIKALYDNLEYIFFIIEDYLDWYLENNGSEKGFLTFGLEAIPKWLRLEETRNLMTELVGDFPMNIRRSRKEFEDDKPNKGKELK